MTSDSLLDGHLHRHCGGRYARASETVTIRVSGMSAVVDRTFFRCDKCGDERRTVEQREQAEQAAVAAMRATHGLLKPKEIRQRRERLGVTTAQFGDLLFGVPQGIVEGWEKGRYVQNPQVDALIRSLDDPETLQHRAARGGVTLPPPPGSEPADGAPDGTLDPADTVTAPDATAADAATTDSIDGKAVPANAVAAPEGVSPVD